MRSVSDNGATAPISALTSAFSFFSNHDHSIDEYERSFIAGNEVELLCQTV